MPYQIQKLSEKDYPEIIKIWEDAVRATHHFLKEEEILFYRPVILKYLFSDCDLYGILPLQTAENTQSIRGFIGTHADKIEMLFISPLYHKQGWGRRLIEFALNELKIYKVDVNEENPQALGFYLHLGYKITSRDEFDGNGKVHPILHLLHQQNQ